ncbi:MAG: molybdopterin-guanine dinucleotide biosynthesis protein B [Bacillota bacterium]|jgi:molybdopterin-guanine dinucleotide biosynthesis protein B
MSVPMISIIAGHADCGKTTIIEGILSVLDRRGFKVAVIKHGRHLSLPTGNKDTNRHNRAGAQVSLLITPEGWLAQGFPEQEPSLEQMSAFLEAYDKWDIILVEGYKRGYQDKIEISIDPQAELFLPPKEAVAYIIKDFDEKKRQLIGNKPVFSPDDVESIADFICSYYHLT